MNASNDMQTIAKERDALKAILIDMDRYLSAAPDRKVTSGSLFHEKVRNHIKGDIS